MSVPRHCEDGNAQLWDGFDAPPLPDGWVDVSWHNEICPAYRVGLLMVWIDNPIRSERLDGTAGNLNAARFGVEYLDLSGTLGRGFSASRDINAPLFESEDWCEVLEFVEGCPLGAPMERVCAHFDERVWDALVAGRQL